MSQYYKYPVQSVSATNPSVGPNGSPSPTQSTLVAGQNPGGNQQPLQTDAAGNLLVNIQSGTGPDDVNLAQVGGTAISLGQKLMAASLPVVLASDETVPISAASLPLPAGASTSALQTSGNASLASLDSKTVHVDTGDVVVASSALPTGAATSALQTSGNASLSSIDSKLATLGQKTMAGSEPVVIASDQSAIPVSAASLPLPTGASTSALQTSGNASLSSIDGKLNSLGQKTMAGSVPVAIASDQSAVPISAASLPLPTGAATEATLSAFSGKSAGALVPVAFDYIALTYVGATTDINTVVYKTGGAGGATVATLTLGYDGSDRLTSVTKT